MARFDVIPIATGEVIHCMSKRGDSTSQGAFYMLIKQKFARI